MTTASKWWSAKMWSRLFAAWDFGLSLLRLELIFYTHPCSSVCAPPGCPKTAASDVVLLPDGFEEFGTCSEHSNRTRRVLSLDSRVTACQWLWPFSLRWTLLTGTKTIVPLGDVAAGYVGNVLSLMGAFACRNLHCKVVRPAWCAHSPSPSPSLYYFVLMLSNCNHLRRSSHAEVFSFPSWLAAPTPLCTRRMRPSFAPSSQRCRRPKPWWSRLRWCVLEGTGNGALIQGFLFFIILSQIFPSIVLNWAAQEPLCRGLSTDQHLKTSVVMLNATFADWIVLLPSFALASHVWSLNCHELKPSNQAHQTEGSAKLDKIW